MKTVLLGDVEDDLFYELRMLLGAAKMCQLSEEIELGNPVNYFKDSIYIHARNLYIFFINKSSNNDDLLIGQLEAKGVYSQLKPKYYGEWRNAWNKYVMHLRNNRSTDTKISNQHKDGLSEQSQNFAVDITRLFREWRDKTSN